MKILVAEGLLQNQYMLPVILQQIRSFRTKLDTLLIIETTQERQILQLEKSDFLVYLEAILKCAVVIIPSSTCGFSLSALQFLYIRSGSFLRNYYLIRKQQCQGKKLIIITRCGANTMYRLAEKWQNIIGFVVINKFYQSPRNTAVPILFSGSCALGKLNCLNVDGDSISDFFEISCSAP